MRPRAAPRGRAASQQESAAEEPTVTVIVPAGVGILVTGPPLTALDVEVVSPGEVRVTPREVPVPQVPPPVVN